LIGWKSSIDARHQRNQQQKGFGFPITAMTAITRDSGDLVSVPAFSTPLLKTNYFPDFDPWATQRFPLGHPDFSTGPPNVLAGPPKRVANSPQETHF
jgi:hypothetical protein